MNTKHDHYIFGGFIVACALAIGGSYIYEAATEEPPIAGHGQWAGVLPEPLDGAVPVFTEDGRIEWQQVQAAVRLLNHAGRGFTLTYREPVNRATIQAVSATLGVVNATGSSVFGTSYEVSGSRAHEYAIEEIADNLIEAGLLEPQPDHTTSTGPCSPNVLGNTGSVALSLDCGTSEGRP